MENVTKYSDCYGCGVCVAACPLKIITIEHNDDGLYTPRIVDIDRCTECGQCLLSCSYNYGDCAISASRESEIPSYAAWSKSPSVREMCSSGGVGFEVAKHLLGEGYSAVGVRYNAEKEIAEHYVARDQQELLQSVGSKYIQSYTADAMAALKRGERYLFFGTPCHIDSMRRYIRSRNIEDNFVLVDFFCHGVPSYNMWKKYLQKIKACVGDVSKIVWRDKKNGWQDSWAMGAVASGSRNEGFKYFSLMSGGDIFYKMFLSDCCLGRACYDRCKFKMTSSSADIRIGDLWGRKYASNREGVSAVLSITPKGESVLHDMSEVTLVSERVEVVAESQMKKSPRRRFYVDAVMRELRGDKSLEQIHKTYVVPYELATYPIKIFKKVVRRVVRIMKR
ncbi:MAG: Coenzyme F420 hydrogenase/dehydrogenase, beta subunit C-terminal domain [Rikenellaceae bacterium]